MITTGPYANPMEAGLYILPFLATCQAWQPKGKILWNGASTRCDEGWNDQWLQHGTLYYLTGVYGTMRDTNGITESDGSVSGHMRFNRLMIKDQTWWCFDSDLSGSRRLA